MRNRLVDTIIPQKEFGDILMCNTVKGADGKRASPERFAVTRIACFEFRQGNAGTLMAG
jgi:hypothetical protein